MSPPLETEELTRKQRREQARAERKALEEQARARAARRQMLMWVGAGAAAVIVVVVIAIAALSGGGGSKASSGGQAGGGSGATAGLQTSPGPWPPEYNNLAVRLQALNLPGQSDTVYHVHAALRVYVNGKQITVPANIGIDPQGQFLAPLHTHDTSGVVHMEASQPYPFKLAQFFTVWGVKFSNTQLGGNIAGNGKTLSMYVNGKLVPNPLSYVIKPHDDIVIGYGKPGSFPTSFQYDWAASGL